MDRRITCMRAREEALRAQSALLQACVHRAAAAHDPRPKSAWIDAVVHLMDMSAVTGSAIADIRWMPRGTGFHELPIRLRLPKLPPLPDEEEGTPPPPNFRKTTASRFRNPISGLAGRPATPRVKSKGGAPFGNRN